MHAGRTLAIAAAVFLLSLSAPAQANDKAAIVAVIIKATAAFDRGDAKTFRPLLAPSQSVIDDVPPHYWSGSRAARASAHAVFSRSVPARAYARRSRSAPGGPSSCSWKRMAIE